MSIAIKLNTQNQQRVRVMTPTTSNKLGDLTDVDIVDQINNATLVYNTATSKYEVKTLPVIFGGTF